MPGGSNPEDGLSSSNGVGEAGEDGIGGVLGNLPFKGINGDLDVHLADRKRRPKMAREQRRTMKTSDTKETRLEFR